MDGFTFFSASTFSTVQSGNVIQVGYWIANQDAGKVLDVAVSILCFGVGAAFMALIQNISKRGRSTVSFHALFIEAGVLALLGLPFVDGEMTPLALRESREHDLVDPRP